MLKYLFIILLKSLLVSAVVTFEPYERLDYSEMRQKLIELHMFYPETIKLSTASEEFGIHDDNICGYTKCELDIVTITDRSVSSEQKVQVFISGAFHGNERLGPRVSFYLIEYLASNFGKDDHITYLLQNREIIITPMTNSYGFYHNHREQRVTDHNSGYGTNVDPNRDFPYNNDSHLCMNTVVGQTVYRLFVENLFVSAITFHGGTNVVAYNWGSNNHIVLGRRAAEAPDHIAVH